MSWKTFLGETVNRLSVFEKEAPETFAGFATMAERAKRDGVLGKQTKEFIALGMADAWDDTRRDGRCAVHDHLYGRWPRDGL